MGWHSRREWKKLFVFFEQAGKTDGTSSVKWALACQRIRAFQLPEMLLAMAADGKYLAGAWRAAILYYVPELNDNS